MGLPAVARPGGGFWFVGAVELVGGVVAFNEERRLTSAVESLLTQELPPEARWQTIWVVASGCTDRTPDVARALAARHPEVQTLFQPERRGKASALGEIFRAARGDYLVLLNADAVARPGAVLSLLQTAENLLPPYAVMGHPEPSELPPGGMGRALQLLWGLHHRLHTELFELGEGTHLSDELLLLPTAHLPPLPEDVVNDGAFIGAWLKSQGGRLAYSTDARVAVEVPWSLADHIRQRRRIHAGHRQVADLVGVKPTTMGQYLAHHPARAIRLLLEVVRARPGGEAALLALVAAEVAAVVASGWDRLPPERNHRLWETIGEPTGSRSSFEPKSVRTSVSPASSDQVG